MKHIYILSIAVLLALSLAAGCFAKKAEAPAPTAAPSADATAASTAAPEAAGQSDGTETGSIQISTKPKTVTTEMDQVTLLILNSTGKTYSTDYVQKLEIQKDGAWQEIPLTTEAVVLGLIVVPDGEITEYTFDFANHYASLEKGSYRITKLFSDGEGNSVPVVCAFDMF